MAKKKSLAIWATRDKFVADRYSRFLEFKKSPISKLPIIHATDLDQLDRESGLYIRDMVLCDRCNQNIEDKFFIIFEKGFVYHFECVKNEADKIPNGARQEYKIDLPEGVLSFQDFKRKKEDADGSR